MRYLDWRWLSPLHLLTILLVGFGGAFLLVVWVGGASLPLPAKFSLTVCVAIYLAVIGGIFTSSDR